MNNIDKTIEFVKDFFSGESTGHDWWHTERVLKNARTIAEKEGGNLFIIEMAALLHDVDDYKFSSVDEEKEKSKARKWLSNLGIEPEVIEKIIDAIHAVSFKGGKNSYLPTTLEAKVVQDADRLDALGAIGIARCFAYGGAKGKAIYDPTLKAVDYQTFEAYKDSKSTSINHFYEKVLLLKDIINTETGKKIAEKRHKFMTDFLDEFYKEWNGHDLGSKG